MEIQTALKWTVSEIKFTPTAPYVWCGAERIFAWWVKKVWDQDSQTK